MAELDQLSIAIEADVSRAEAAIDKLIASFERLDGSLNLGNLETFTKQLKDISDASSGMKEVSKDIKAISDAGSKLASLTGFKTLNDQMNDVDKTAESLMKSLSKDFNFGIDKDNARSVKELQDMLSNLLRYMGKNGISVVDENNIKLFRDCIEGMARYRLPVTEDLQNVAKWAKQTDLALDESTKGWLKYKGLLSDVRGIFKSVSDEGVKGASIHDLSGELDKLGVAAGDTQTRILDVLDKVRKYKTEYHDALVSGEDVFKRGLIPKEALDYSTDELKKGLESAYQSIFEQQKAHTVFDDIVPSLKELSTITLPDFGGLNVLADGLTKLSTVKTDKIRAIVDALNGVGETKVSGLDGLAQKATEVAQAVNNVKASDTSMESVASGAQQASNAVALLVDKMHGFSSYTQSMETAAQIFERIARSMAMSMFTKMNEDLARIGEGSNFPRLESNIIDITNSVKELKTISSDIGESLRMASDSDGLSSISSDAKEARSEISRLYEELRNLRSAKNDFVKGKGEQSSEYYDNLVQSIAEVEQKIKDYNAALKEAQKEAEAVDITPKMDFSKLEPNIGELKNIQAALEGFADKFAKSKEYNVEPIADSLDKVSEKAEEATEKMSAFESSLRMIAESGFSQNGISSELARTLDTITALKQDIKTMESNTGVLDYDKLVRSNKELNQAELHLAKIREDMTRQSRVGSPLTEEAKEAQRLQDRMYELQRLIAEVNSRKVAPDPAQYKAWNEELKEVRDRYNEIMGLKDKVEKPSANAKTPSIDLLANLVALGHEIENISRELDRLGDFGIKGLKLAFKPLDHVIKEYREKIESIGDAFKAMHDKAKRHIDKLSAFWKRSMKTFTFMLVRKAITAVLTELSDAIKSLAVWSKQFGTIFNDSMSQITSNFSYIARSIVGAFEPIINFVVPAFNALADAIANAMAKLGEFFAAMTGQGYYMAAKKQVVDYADEVEKARKAQKNLIAGLDDLNIITTPTATNSGMDDVAEQWKKVDVSDRMKAIADEIKAFAKKLFDPIKKAWDKVGQHVIDGWKYMTGEIKKLLKDIGRDFMKVWEQAATQTIFENLFDSIGYIEEAIGHLARNFRKAWNTNDVGLHILENIRDIIVIITSHVNDMAKAFRDWADELDFYPLLAAVEEFTRKVQPLVDFLGNVLGDIWERVILRHWKWQIEKGVPHLLETVGDVISAFNWDKIRKDLQPLEDAFETMSENIEKGLVDAFGNLGERVAEFANSEDFTNFTKNVAWFMEQITAERVEKLFTALGDAILNVAESLMKFVGSDEFKDFIQKLWDWYDSKSAEEIADLLTKIAMAIAAFKFTAFVGKGIGEFFKFLAVLQALKGTGGISGLLGGASGVGIEATLASLGTAAAIIGGVVAAIYSLVKSFGGIQGVLEELKKHFDLIKQSLSDAFEKSGIADAVKRLKDAFNGLLNALGNQKSFWQALFYLVDALISLFANVAVPVLRTIIDIITGLTNGIKGLLDVVGGFFDMLKGFFTGDSDLVSEGARRMCEGVINAFRGAFGIMGVPFQLVKAFVDGVVEFFRGLKYALLGDPIVIDIVDGVIQWFTTMMKDGLEVIGDLVDGAIEFFTNLFNDGVELFKKLKDGVIEKAKQMKEKVIEKAKEMKTRVLSTITELKNEAINRFNALKNEAVNRFNALKEEALQKFNELKERAVGAFNNLKNDAISAFNNLKNDVVGIASQTAEDVSHEFWDMVGWASDAFWGVVNNAGSILGNLGSTISRSVGDLWSTAKGWGKNILDGLTSGLNDNSGWNNVKRSVGLLVDAVDGTWRKLTRTYSPSRMFVDFGEYLVEGLNVGIDDNIGSSEKEVKKWFNDIAQISLPQFDFSQAIPKNNLRMDNYQHIGVTGAIDNTAVQESVRAGVMDAVGSLILPYLNDIAQSSRETANKELKIGDKQIGQSAQRYARDVYARTGKPAYGF